MLIATPENHNTLDFYRVCHDQLRYTINYQMVWYVNGMYEFQFFSFQGKRTAVFMSQLEIRAAEIASVEKLRKPHSTRLGVLCGRSRKNADSFHECFKALH